MKVLRGKVRALTNDRRLTWSVEKLLSRMNPIWGNYFDYGSSSASFSAIESYVIRCG